MIELLLLTTLSFLLLTLSISLKNLPVEIVIRKGYPVSKVCLNTNIIRFESSSSSSRSSSSSSSSSSSNKVKVDLISTLHIAESDYYNNIKNQLNQYDVVLYEVRVLPPLLILILIPLISL